MVVPLENIPSPPLMSSYLKNPGCATDFHMIEVLPIYQMLVIHKIDTYILFPIRVYCSVKHDIVT